MKVRAISRGVLGAILLGTFAACSSVPAEARKPAVAILISAQPGEQPSPAELAEIHTMLQPLIERQGYVMAKSSRAADYFVSVRFPVDPATLGRVTFEKAEPTVPFLKDTDPDQQYNSYKRAIADMVTQPK